MAELHGLLMGVALSTGSNWEPILQIGPLSLFGLICGFFLQCNPGNSELLGLVSWPMAPVVEPKPSKMFQLIPMDSADSKQTTNLHPGYTPETLLRHG